jgi:hypothetical protein
VGVFFFMCDSVGTEVLCAQHCFVVSLQKEALPYWTSKSLGCPSSQVPEDTRISSVINYFLSETKYASKDQFQSKKFRNPTYSIYVKTNSPKTNRAKVHCKL